MAIIWTAWVYWPSKKYASKAARATNATTTMRNTYAL